MPAVALTGFAAYGLLFVAVVTGAVPGRAVRSRVRPAGPPGLARIPPRMHRSHEVLGLGGLCLGLLHAAEGLPRGWAALAWLFPFAGPSPGLGMELGVGALWATLLAVAAFYLRRGLRSPLWRRVHLLAYPAFFAAAWHGLAVGADGWLPAVRLLYAFTLAGALLALGWRAADWSAAWRARRAARPSGG